MPEEPRRALTAFYAEHNARLGDYLGRDLAWSS